jgi:hypothetical protein
MSTTTRSITAPIWFVPYSGKIFDSEEEWKANTPEGTRTYRLRENARGHIANTVARAREENAKRGWSDKAPLCYPIDFMMYLNRTSREVLQGWTR